MNQIFFILNQINNLFFLGVLCGPKILGFKMCAVYASLRQWLKNVRRRAGGTKMRARARQIIKIPHPIPVSNSISRKTDEKDYFSI